MKAIIILVILSMLFISACNKVKINNPTADENNFMNIPQANFSYHIEYGETPKLLLINTSTEYESVEWYFIDGMKSNERIIERTLYPTNEYSVKLTATNSLGSHEVTKLISLQQGSTPSTVNILDNVAWYYYGNKCTPFTLNIYLDDAYKGYDNYLWNFDDISSGSNISTLPEPSHTYSNSGIYHVELTITDSLGAQVYIGTEDIMINEVPEAEFYATPEVSSILDANIEFYDQSTPVSSWDWYFGDGTSSQEQNPNHTYLSVDTFQVVLVSTTSSGCFDYVGHTIEIKY